MRKRILWNDINGNRLPAITTWLFMALSAFLFALTCFLFVSLLGSVDTLMEKAQTPDFLQMHAGEIKEEELARFAEKTLHIQAQVDDSFIFTFSYCVGDSQEKEDDMGGIENCQTFMRRLL